MKDKIKTAVHEMYSGSNKEVLTENANKDSSIIPTQRDLLAGAVSKEYALEHILPAYIAKAHKAGYIHFHDLDYSPFFPMFNCMLIDVKGMLEQGFRMGNAQIEPPKSISTACAVTAQIIAQVASHIYGGNTVDRIDEVLAPYVKASYQKHMKDAEQWIRWPSEEMHEYAFAMTKRETYNAFQALEYEINTLHTANGQTPFTTLGFGLGQGWEARLIQQSILQVRMDGLGKTKKTAVFPKLVFSIRKGVNFSPEDCNYDIKQMALKCASERMYPDILNYDQVVKVTGNFKAPMGCRSFLSQHGNEIAGRNNLGVVSLNLPRIALESESIEEFFDKLEAYATIAIDALYLRIKRMDNVKAKVAPILYCEGAAGVRLDPEDYVADIFKDGRASISLGYIGLHETVNALFDDKTHPFDSKHKRAVAEDIVKYLRLIVDEEKAKSGYGFSLYSTPSESLCDRFCKLDIKKFGIIPGVTDKGYYTNSFHLDVFKKVSPFEKIDFEKAYPAMANGGYISFVEFPNMRHNLKGLEAIWDYTYDKLPYFGTNTPVDYCGECGFAGEAKATRKGFECPSCGNGDPKTLSVTRRVCGYLGAPNSRPFNPGKQEEVIGRVKHE